LSAAKKAYAEQLPGVQKKVSEDWKEAHKKEKKAPAEPHTDHGAAFGFKKAEEPQDSSGGESSDEEGIGTEGPASEAPQVDFGSDDEDSIHYSDDVDVTDASEPELPQDDDVDSQFVEFPAEDGGESEKVAILPDYLGTVSIEAVCTQLASAPEPRVLAPLALQSGELAPPVVAFLDSGCDAARFAPADLAVLDQFAPKAANVDWKPLRVSEAYGRKVSSAFMAGGGMVVLGLAIAAAVAVSKKSKQLQRERDCPGSFHIRSCEGELLEFQVVPNRFGEVDVSELLDRLAVPEIGRTLSIDAFRFGFIPKLMEALSGDCEWFTELYQVAPRLEGTLSMTRDEAAVLAISFDDLPALAEKIVNAAAAVNVFDSAAPVLPRPPVLEFPRVTLALRSLGLAPRQVEPSGTVGAPFVAAISPLQLARPEPELERMRKANGALCDTAAPYAS
jgi:hypothetical protein